MLAGPGSEFSLANQDTDLELDYYDYNVVNAGSAPGSYLGMDPAFLVWIPPLTEDESDALPEKNEEPYYEEIPERPIDGEHRSQTTEEYGDTVTDLKYHDSGEGIIKPKKLEPGECRLHDEIIMEYKARLGEGMLPIHRVLEESRVRVSEESLSSNSDALSNRTDSSKSKASNGKQQKKVKRSSRFRFSKRETSSESSTQSLNAQETGSKPKSKTMDNDLDTPRTKRKQIDQNQSCCDVNILNANRAPHFSRKRHELSHSKSKENGVHIPLAEFSRSRQESPVKVHESSRTRLELQSPEIGETKQSFYALIGEGEDGIKFADDDDEYLDNKAAV